MCYHLTIWKILEHGFHRKGEIIQTNDLKFHVVWSSMDWSAFTSTTQGLFVLDFNAHGLLFSFWLICNDHDGFLSLQSYDLIVFKK